MLTLNGQTRWWLLPYIIVLLRVILVHFDKGIIWDQIQWILSWNPLHCILIVLSSIYKWMRICPLLYRQLPFPKYDLDIKLGCFSPATEACKLNWILNMEGLIILIISVVSWQICLWALAIYLSVSIKFGHLSKKLHLIWGHWLKAWLLTCWIHLRKPENIYWHFV